MSTILSVNDVMTAAEALGLKTDRRTRRMQCPAHDGVDLNCKVDPGTNGAGVVIACHSHGCDYRDIVAALGLDNREPIRPQPRSQNRAGRAKPEIVATYEYQNEAGELSYQTVRKEPKGFYQRRPGNRGEWINNLNGIEPLPYRLPELLASADLVLIPEGEKDVDNLYRLGFIATCNHGGAGKHIEIYPRYLRGRDVVIFPDNDQPGRDHAEKVASSLAGIAASMRVVELSGLPEKGDVSDWITAGGTAEQLRSMIDRAKPWAASDQTGDTKAEESESKRKPPQATQLVQLVTNGGAELFHDPDRTAFARLKVRDHFEVWPINSTGFKDHLGALYYAEHRAVAGSQGIGDAIGTLAGIARYEGEELPVSIRTAAGDDGAIYLDLGDADWRSIKVTPAGWDVVTDCPARFQRTSTSRALPYPERGGDIRELVNFVNVRISRGQPDGDADFLLLLGFAIAALRPTGPYPILDLAGEQGGGKSTTARVIRRLTDPRKVELANFPRDDRDLAATAGKNQLLIFDNVSSISNENSDKLCRLSTGGGFVTRRLYTDDDEHAIDAMRPVILTGIPDLSTRSDLADRTITLEAPSLRGGRRISELEFWTAFDNASPKLFGALLDVLVCALRNLPASPREGLPRMADFARLGEAMLPALGREPGSFTAAMRANEEQQNTVILEAHPEAAALLQWAKTWGDDERTTTAAVLLDQLGHHAPDGVRQSKSWPKTPKDLSANLRRLAPNLGAAGLRVEFTRTMHGRSIHLIRSNVIDLQDRSRKAS